MLSNVVDDKNWLSDLVYFIKYKEKEFQDYMWEKYKPCEHSLYFVNEVEKIKKEIDDEKVTSPKIRLSWFYIKMSLAIKEDKKLLYYVLDVLENQ